MVNTIKSEDISALFPTRPRRMNKGDAGRVLCVCGSYDHTGASMCGAAYFSAAAAYKCGAGMVEIFTHRKNYEALASLVPEAIFTLYDTEKESHEDIANRLFPSIRKADSVVLGCGLGKGNLSCKLVRNTLEIAGCPLVIDADGLNIIAESKELAALVKDRSAVTVFTPHPGEMSRLTGKSIPEILSDAVGTAENFAKENKLICLLKDNKTVITDGMHTFINQSGNAGMATAGMGDVLSGIIGALLARSALSDDISTENSALPSALYRTATAAYIHGLAGDIAAEKFGEYSITASDAVNSLYKVIKPQN